jgi:hypothetical protein
MFKSQINSKLDAQIVAALDKLDELDPKSEEYATIVERVAKLHKLKTEGRQYGLTPPSVDNLLIVGANIFGILWLARYERENVIKAPNAFRTMMRPK